MTAHQAAEDDRWNPNDLPWILRPSPLIPSPGPGMIPRLLRPSPASERSSPPPARP